MKWMLKLEVIMAICFRLVNVLVGFHLMITSIPKQPMSVLGWFLVKMASVFELEIPKWFV